MTAILLVGGSGMLGHRLALELANHSGIDLHVTVRHPVPEPFRAQATYHAGIDLSSGSAPMANLLGDLAPAVIINAVGAVKQKNLAAATDQTMFLNGALPHLLALLNPNPAGRVVHISTDCVYRGDRGGYAQFDPPDAVDLYGRSKAVGELAYGRHLTLRTSIIGFEIGAFLGLLSWLFRQPRGSALPAFTHAQFSGLTTAALSRTIAAVVTAAEIPTGLWHVAAEPITKYDLLSRVNQAFDLGHSLQSTDTVRIDRTLDDTPWRLHTGTQRPGWDELVAGLVTDWAAYPYAARYAALSTLQKGPTA